MATTLVALDQASLEMAMAMRRRAGETLESVIARALKDALRARSQEGPRAPEMPRRERLRIVLLGEAYEVPTARDVLITTLQRLQELDARVLPALSHRTGRTRRIVASTPAALYPGRPDLAKHSYRLEKDWWVGTNYSTRDIDRIVRLACSVAGLEFGADLVVSGPGWGCATTDDKSGSQRRARLSDDEAMPVRSAVPGAAMRH